MKSFKNILLVSSGSLPVPPVMGGAVECLIDYLLQQNEIDAKYYFLVTSIYNESAVKIAEKYKKTQFIFIRQGKMTKKTLFFLSKIVYKLTHKSIRYDYRNYVKKICKYIKKNQLQIDCILVENNGSYIDLLKEINRPIFYHLHNDYLNSKVEQAEKILNTCKGIITVTDFIASKVGTIPEGYKKTKVLLNCTDVKRFDSGKYEIFRKDFRNKNKISDTDTVLIFAGRLHPTKGVKELLQAFNQIENKHVFLLIAGGDWYSTNHPTPYVREIQELAREKEGQILWTGYIDWKLMPRYYACADIGVFPSIWEEPSNLAVLEAEAAGLPLIASRTGGIPENSSEETTIYISIDEKEKMIQEMLQAMVILISNPDLRLKMSQASLEYVSTRNKEEYFRNFVKIMDDFGKEGKQN